MNTTLSALADPNRLRLVELLREGPRSVNDMVAHLHLSQPLVSKHLRVLSAAGLVSARPSGQQRIYQLEAQPFQQLNQWLDSFQRVWDARLDHLDDYLQELKHAESK